MQNGSSVSKYQTGNNNNLCLNKTNNGFPIKKMDTCDKSSFPATIVSDTKAGFLTEWHQFRNRKIPALYKFNEVPEYLRFNPFVLNGYREYNLSFWKSICSLFYLHNETVNILSHGKFLG